MSENISSLFADMNREDRERFLVEALRGVSPESLTGILSQAHLRDLLPAQKARIVSRLGVTAVAHSYRNRETNDFIWTFPSVPTPFRPVVYTLSRMVMEFEAALSSAVQGRGDFAQVVLLIDPGKIENLTQDVRQIFQVYIDELRNASGRNRRPGRPRQSLDTVSEEGKTEQTPEAETPAHGDDSQDTSGSEPEAGGAEPDAEPAAKPKRGSRKAKADTEAEPEQEVGAVENSPEANTENEALFEGVMDSYIR